MKCKAKDYIIKWGVEISVLLKAGFIYRKAWPHVAMK